MLTAISNDHQDIREAAAALRALLIEDGVPIGHWLASSRWSLTRQMLRHFGTQGAARALEQRYRRHLADWTPARIDQHWPRYCGELRDILDAMEVELDAADHAPCSEPVLHHAGARG